MAGSIKLSLMNNTSSAFSGPVTITLYLSTDAALSTDDTALPPITLPKVNIRAGAAKISNLRFDYPGGAMAGQYYIIASISASTTAAAAEAVSATAVALSPASVDLATAFKNDSPIVVNSTRGNSVTITLTNDGNVTAIGTIALQLYASDNTLVDSTAEALGKLLTRTIHLRAGHSITLHLRFAAPTDKVSGTYNLIASTTATTNPADSNPANDSAVLQTV
jgi:hypothetical protein